jgi:hypothetical protein
MAKDFAQCVLQALAGRLPTGQTAAQCRVADNKSRVVKAQTRTALADTKYCDETPGFGPTAWPGVNAAFEDALPIDAVYGPDLDAALAATPAADCHAAVAKGIAKVLATRLKVFNACKKGL